MISWCEVEKDSPAWANIRSRSAFNTCRREFLNTKEKVIMDAPNWGPELLDAVKSWWEVVEDSPAWATIWYRLASNSPYCHGKFWNTQKKPMTDSPYFFKEVKAKKKKIIIIKVTQNQNFYFASPFASPFFALFCGTAKKPQYLRSVFLRRFCSAHKCQTMKNVQKSVYYVVGSPLLLTTSPFENHLINISK